MSTRSIIARVTEAEGGFRGVYHHWDGYPEALGKHLWDLQHNKYKGDLGAMLAYVIDKHSGGWSSLMPNSETGKPECFCHPGRKRAKEPMGQWFTHENIGSDIEWIYVFDESAQRLYIRDNRADAEMLADLDGPEPDWATIACGENLERCTHYAWRHFPEMEGCNLSTAVYLGQRDFDFRDAIAVIKAGKRYRLTGSGRRGDYAARFGMPLPRGLKVPLPDVWISGVKAANGHGMDLLTAIQEHGDYRPYPGVTWVFPPTRDNPNETLRDENERSQK